MAFFCSICGEESTRICERCTKDTCSNHLCEKCHRCSDCCECEVLLDQAPPVVRPAMHAAPPAPEPAADPGPVAETEATHPPVAEPVPVPDDGGPEAP